MRGLSWFNKIIYLFNILLIGLTFGAYVLPFLTPRLFPILAVFTLLLPLVLVFNMLFFIYWAIQLKKQMFLSALVLFLGITFINKFYKFSKENLPQEATDFTLMSYNVRLFNHYQWIANVNVPNKITDFVHEKNPDILCIQEFYHNKEVDFSYYQYRSIFLKNNFGQAIFSKYKIINKGVIDFPQSSNNVIFADIVKGKDTIRIYSMHMQSIKISPDLHENLDKMNREKSKRVFRRISVAFKEQQIQMEIFKKHKKECRYTQIICGDMNNSAFSYVYSNIKGELKDSFEEAGIGFGKTYDYNYYPARIDYVFVDKNIKVKDFTVFSSFIHSDHFPIIVRLGME